MFRFAATIAVPSPAKRGKVGRRPGRGQAFDFDLDASSKIKSSPLHPLRGSFPRKRGKRKQEFHRADNCRSFPRAAGEGGSTDPEGGRLLTLILMLQARSRAAPFTPFGGASPVNGGSESFPHRPIETKVP